MKTSTKTGLIAALLLTSGAASADWSGNIGFQSDYYFRGIFQKASSAQGGIDFESSGFYAGVWAADVGGDIDRILRGIAPQYCANPEVL